MSVPAYQNEAAVAEIKGAKVPHLPGESPQSRLSQERISAHPSSESSGDGRPWWRFGCFRFCVHGTRVQTRAARASRPLQTKDEDLQIGGSSIPTTLNC